MSNDVNEVNVNTIGGLLINYILTLLMFGTTAEYALGTSAVFFCVSYIRSMLVRKWFRNHENKN